MFLTRSQLRQIIYESLSEAKRKPGCDQWLEYMKTQKSDEWNAKLSDDMTQGEEWMTTYEDASQELNDECLYTLDDMQREDQGVKKKEKRATPLMDKLNKVSRRIDRATDLSRMSSNVSTNLERDLRKKLGLS